MNHVRGIMAYKWLKSARIKWQRAIWCQRHIHTYIHQLPHICVCACVCLHMCEHLWHLWQNRVCSDNAAFSADRRLRSAGSQNSNRTETMSADRWREKSCKKRSQLRQWCQWWQWWQSEVPNTNGGQSVIEAPRQIAQLVSMLIGMNVYVLLWRQWDGSCKIIATLSHDFKCNNQTVVASQKTKSKIQHQK